MWYLNLYTQWGLKAEGRMGVKYEPIKGKEERIGSESGNDLESGLEISKKPHQQQHCHKQQRLVSLDVFRGLTVAVIYFLFPPFPHSFIH